ncbi:MAG TPA: serine/threonine-protein kinase [Tahibacter sp.]|nr:serine/threonine-protein kinase [Tahibacter sp.]
MNPEEARFRRLETLFHAALALLPEKRNAYLDAECAGDAALRAELAGLLDAGSPDEPGPATAALAGARRQLTIDHASLPQGATVGVWRLIRVLGSGGMGNVYLAERTDGIYRAHAALKMLSPWLRGGAFETRFALERQILSDLRHPAIATLLDGGVAADGTPYLVMEYVEGEPITQFAQTQALDIPGRLRLLLAVCHAVQHAHQNLVIHRDLKPGNILVAGDGRPKLLDFGIAKLLLPLDGAQRPEDAPEATRILTPEYASPEQIRGEPVTTASDVYSLGVILYQLLVGERPRNSGTGSALPPPRPSSAVLQVSLAAPPWNTPAQRQPWSRRLRGDLDTLVLKSLAAEPERRYATAQQLGDDIERYLRNQPLNARPDTLRYRTRKFFRRHRVGVALAAVALTVIVGAAVSLAVLAVRLRDERDRSAAAQGRAEYQRKAAERVAQFLARLFEGANPNPAEGAAPTLRDVLDRGAKDVGEQLKDDAPVQARLLVLMANAYRQLGENAKGIALAEQAVALRRAQQPQEPAELADSIDALGELRRADADYAQAERLHREALSLRRELAPSDPVLIGRSLNNLALTLYEAGRNAEALPLYEASLALRRRALGDSAPPVLSTLVNIGLLRRTLGDYASAEAAFREVLEQRLRTLGETHLSTANVMTHLGRTLVSRGHNDEAESLLRRALAVRRQLLGDRNADVSISLYELAYALQQQGKLEQAEAALRESRAIDLQLYGTDHAETAQTLARLGTVLLAQGRLEPAEQALRESLRIVQRNLAPGHARIAAAQSYLADVLVARGQTDPAEPLYRAALETQRRQLRADHPEVGHSLLGLAQVALLRGDLPAAAARLDEGEPILRAAPSDFEDQRRRLQRLRADLAKRAERDPEAARPASG